VVNSLHHIDFKEYRGSNLYIPKSHSKINNIPCLCNKAKMFLYENYAGRTIYIPVEGESLTSQEKITNLLKTKEKLEKQLLNVNERLKELNV
jgi:hypothetical protein